ncbi:hypothetical protein [Sphingomonas sp. CFBP 13720]|uniref:hypothetical protein n=1 Tax=Sphingomonas sp. CFBP 13720 TaxID=2775302 RepID=UPI002017357B|nr:hypothetical protein [Sphingomonas sp. CFBP 13720]
MRWSIAPRMDIAALYADLIHQIGDGTGMADSLLHVHAGMAVLLATRVITGYRLSTPVPLLVVMLAELCNEVLDRIHWDSWRWADTSLDIVNTLFWPAMLFVGLRVRDRLDRKPAVEGNAAG